jgi:hypothetical protein
MLGEQQVVVGFTGISASVDAANARGETHDDETGGLIPAVTESVDQPAFASRSDADPQLG